MYNTNMFQVRKGIHIVIFSYIVVCLIIWHYKPKIMFENNKIKKFGIGYDKTICNYQITIILLAIILFYIYEIYWMKKNNIL
jgi:hypothetical protein